MQVESVSTLKTPELANNKDYEAEINKEQLHNDNKKDTFVDESQRIKMDESKIIQTIESANDEIQIYNRSLKFSIHEKTKEIMVKVIDTETEEVIREIPPEEILDMVAKLWELAGILVDEKV